MAGLACHWDQAELPAETKWGKAVKELMTLFAFEREIDPRVSQAGEVDSPLWAEGRLAVNMIVSESGTLIVSQIEMAVTGTGSLSVVCFWLVSTNPDVVGSDDFDFCSGYPQKNYISGVCVGSDFL